MNNTLLFLFVLSHSLKLLELLQKAMMVARVTVLCLEYNWSCNKNHLIYCSYNWYKFGNYGFLIFKHFLSCNCQYSTPVQCKLSSNQYYKMVFNNL